MWNLTMVITFFTSIRTFQTSTSGFCFAGALADSQKKRCKHALIKAGQGNVLLCVSLESAVLHRAVKLYSCVVVKGTKPV